MHKQTQQKFLVFLENSVIPTTRFQSNFSKLLFLEALTLMKIKRKPKHEILLFFEKFGLKLSGWIEQYKISKNESI